MSEVKIQVSEKTLENKAVDNTPEIKSNSPFTARVNVPKHGDFDKYYIEVTEKEVFKETGQVDPDTGDKIGVVEKKYILKKIDIQEYLDSQADSVGVASYMKALTLQGTPIEEFNTQVDQENVQDFSEMPNTLAEVMTAGDRAKEAFQNMDPELRGSHTTIEGFLNGLNKEVLDKYIQSKVESFIPKQVEKKEGE